MRNVRLAAVAFLAAFLASSAPAAKAADILVTVDASSIADGTAGFLDIQFNAGGATAQLATAMIMNFTSTNLTLSAITHDGASSGGPLPADVTIDNDVSYPFNGALQAVTFDTNASFSLIVRLTGPAMNTMSDFSTTFFLNLVGPEPNYDSLLPDAIPHLSITIPQDGSGDLVITSVPQITGTVVPEPGTVVLAMTGALVLAAARRKSAISTTGANRSWGLPTAIVVAHPHDGLMFASPGRPCQPVRRRRGQRPDKPHEQTSDFGQCQRDQGLEAALFWGTDADTRRTSRKACANRASVTCRCQPSQLRNS